MIVQKLREKMFSLLQIASVCCVLGTNSGYAEFDPTPEVRDSLISSDATFLDLKEKVIQYLSGSWCSSEKASMLMDLTYLEKPKVCVEIGVFTGSSLLPVLATLKYFQEGTMYAIDPWSNQESIKNLSEDDPNRTWWSQVNMHTVQSMFSSMLKEWSLSSYCRVITKTAMLASQQIPNIDFLHIDGNYSEQSSLEDVANYFPKVKVGGYVLLSNVLLSVNGSHPKMEAFFQLLDGCKIIAELENGNAYLLQKETELPY